MPDDESNLNSVHDTLLKAIAKNRVIFSDFIFHNFSTVMLQINAPGVYQIFRFLEGASIRGGRSLNFYSFAFFMKNHFLVTRYIRLHNV